MEKCDQTYLQQQHLINLINAHSFDDFLLLYDVLKSTLEVFEHIELLFRASRFGTLLFVQTILNSSPSTVNVNSCHPSTGFPLLFITIRAQQHEIIEYLIQKTEVNVNWCCARTSVTCLHEAIRQWDLSTIILLLQHGAIINESHLFTSIIECYSLETKEILSSPLLMLNTILLHRTDLIDKIGRMKIIEFVLRRSRWPSPKPTILLLPLLQRLCLNTDIDPNVYMPSESTDPIITALSSAHTHNTQVAIIGAGPAGLMLGNLLSRFGIDTIILERHSRSEVESIIRAGVLEQTTVDLLDEVNASEQLFKKGFVQRCINFQFDGERLTLQVARLTQGKASVIYGQQFVLRDLIKARLNSGRRLWFDIESVRIEQHDVTDDGSGPLIKFRRLGQTDVEYIRCDFIAGCDGATSDCCRRSVPPGVLHTIERAYPYAWLSILVEAPPSTTELTYSTHSKHGFAIQSFRCSSQTRFHLQVPCTDTLSDWPDERIWIALKQRLATNNDSWTLNQGPITERSLFHLRHSITSPMQYKRLFLLGDAIHIVPPTGAKGLNVAVKDAQILTEALVAFYEDNQWDKLNNYTTTCALHIWRAQEFASYMTLLLHKLNSKEDDDSNNTSLDLDIQLQRARQRIFQQSYGLQHYFAEMIACNGEHI